MMSVAQAWLTHPMATRYANTLFLPGGEETIRHGTVYLNSWREQPCKPGDVTMFLDLTRFIYGETRATSGIGRSSCWRSRCRTRRGRYRWPSGHRGPGSGKSLQRSWRRAAFGEYADSRRTVRSDTGLENDPGEVPVRHDRRRVGPPDARQHRDESATASLSHGSSGTRST